MKTPTKEQIEACAQMVISVLVAGFGGDEISESVLKKINAFLSRSEQTKP